MTTVKELSASIGVSKVSLYALIKKDEYKPYVSKIDNTTVIDDSGAALVRAYYSRERDASFNELGNDLQDETTDILDFLKEQLREKDNQINALTTAVNTLSRAVENEQQLRVVPLLPVHSGKPNKKSLFEWLFKKS